MAKKKAKPGKPIAPKKKRGRRPDVLPDWAPAFLAALVTEGTVFHACRTAGVDSTTVYARKKDDADFARAFASAQEDANDVIEREAIRRGVEGYLEPIVYKGRVMGEFRTPDGLLCLPDAPGAAFVPSCLRRYSDGLLSNLLRWRRYPDPKAGDGDDEPPMFDREGGE